jgi:hypothetical protein
MRPADGISVIAHLAGRSLGSTNQAARMLREAGLDLWPDVGRGRRSGSVSARHLVNLLLALTAPGGEPGAACQNVGAYKALRLRARSLSIDVAEGAGLGGTQFADIAHADVFGDFLDDLVERLGTDLADPTRGAPLATFLSEYRFALLLQRQPDMPPLASVVVGGGARISFTALGAPIERREHTAAGALDWYDAPQQRARHTSEISWGVLISLAAAFAFGRRDFAYLPPDALRAAIAATAPAHVTT